MESESRQRHQPISVYPETGMSRDERRRLNADNLRSKLRVNGLTSKDARRASALGLLQVRMARHNTR